MGSFFFDNDRYINIQTNHARHKYGRIRTHMANEFYIYSGVNAFFIYSHHKR